MDVWGCIRSGLSARRYQDDPGFALIAGLPLNRNAGARPERTVIAGSLWSARGTGSQVFGPAHASKSTRERSGGMIESDSPTIASSGM